MESNLLDELSRIEPEREKDETAEQPPSPPPEVPPKPREYDDYGEPVTQTFTLYTHSDFHSADKIAVHTIRKRGGAERYVGALQKTSRGHFEEKGEGVADPTGTPSILHLRIDESRFFRDGARTAGGDQYITLEFIDGARLWYKQPRARPNRDRPDTWIRGRMGVASILGQTGQTFIQGANMYPAEIKFTRDRHAGDPDHDVDYSKRLSNAKTATTIGLVLTTLGLITAGILLGPAIVTAASATVAGALAGVPVAISAEVAISAAIAEGISWGAVGSAVATSVIPVAIIEAVKLGIDAGLNGKS